MHTHITKNQESGFSLIEAIITITIFAMVLSAIFGVLRIGNLMRTSVNDRSEITANARTAINMIGKEAVNAGVGYSRIGGIVPDDFASNLLGIPQDPNTNRDLFPGIIAGDEISESDLSVNGQKNDVVAFVARDLHFNNGEPVIITDHYEPGSEPFLIVPDGCASCNRADVYLVESSDGNQALVMATNVMADRIEINDNDPLGLNRDKYYSADQRSILTKCNVGETANCFNYTPQATAKRIFITSYSVDQTGTLIRTTYGNNPAGTIAEQIQKQPLAFGVQRFQVKYLMQDGSLVDDPSQGNTNQLKLNEVVQVEIKLTIKSETDVNGVTSTQLLNLDSTFSTRNLRYDVD